MTELGKLSETLHPVGLNSLYACPLANNNSKELENNLRNSISPYQKQFRSSIHDRAVVGVVPGLEDQFWLSDQRIKHNIT